MSRIKETTNALPIISRSSHRKNLPPREHDDANSTLEERLAKANVLVRISNILACVFKVHLLSP